MKGNEKGHYVYKYVLNDEIIYIGKTDRDLESRINEHGVPGDNIPKSAWHEINKSDIYFIKLPNATMSDVVESELINRYKPKHNKAKMSDWCGIPFEEPQWEKYEKPVKVKRYTTVKKPRPLKNYFDHNKKAIAILRDVIIKLTSGEFEIEDGKYKIDVSDICENGAEFLFNSCVRWDTEISIGLFNFFSSVRYGCGEVWCYFDTDFVEERAREVLFYYDLEANKYA